MIRKWHVVSTGTHDFQLVVLHKKLNGKYKNVGESSIESVPGYGSYEFSASMPIHKGEFVGLSTEAVAGIDNNTAATLTLRSHLAVWARPEAELLRRH